MKSMKLYAGQKVVVKIYNVRPELWNRAGEMDVWMGKLVTIKNPVRVTIKEAVEWTWSTADFEIPVHLSDDLFEI